MLHQGVLDVEVRTVDQRADGMTNLLTPEVRAKASAVLGMTAPL